MNIGILTFHRSINYGSVLQTWALQHVLKKNGINSEVIDYEPRMYKLLYESNAINAVGIKSKIKKLLQFKKKTDKQHQMFEQFRDKELSISAKKFFYDTTYDAYDNYDVIIAGSDQIWNTNISDCDPIYFLPFSFRGKKIAYACSINSGKANDRYSKEWLREKIKDFHCVSIREQSGVKKVVSLTDRDDIENLPDPTLLLNRNDYSELIGNRIQDGKYIFMYNMWTKKEGLQLASIISKQLKMPVYTITNQMDLIRIIKNMRYGIKTDMKHTSPSDFLNFIYNAEFVITDSFHGTAFSIVFNKQFVTINSRLENGEYKNDERLNSLLQKLGLIDRFVKLDEVNSLDLNNEINYEPVEKIRESLSTEAEKWLLKAIFD